jgi:radical SAM protein with 4Fe4S-binding SPASM domain
MIRAFLHKGFVPVHVQLEVTWRCNWHCVHCYQDDHSKQVLDLRRLESLFVEMADCGTMHVIVTGGEPLVRRDLFHVLRAIRSHRMGVTLYTNGQLVDSVMAQRLSQLIATAEISVLAGEEGIHDMLTQRKGSFRSALTAISELRRHNIPVIVKTPLLKPALHTIKVLEEKMDLLGVEWHVDPEISRTYAGATGPLQYHLNYAELQNFFREFPRFNPQQGYNADPGVERGVCLAGRQYCFIDAEGNVYPCLNFKSASDVEEKGGSVPRVKMGNILDRSFSSIWNDAKIAHEIRSASHRDFKTCARCSASAGCNSCMALNYEEHGELFRPAQLVCSATAAARSVFESDFVPASGITWS